MKNEQLYKGYLTYLDGTREEIDIPGETDEQGTVYVPESVTLQNRTFKLIPGNPDKAWFEYQEVKSGKWLVPYRSDLH